MDPAPSPIGDEAQAQEQARLLAAMAIGEQAALAQLYDSLAKPLYSLAFRVLNNASEAQDVVQDVFVQYAALDYLKKKAPRVCYISFGETDEWAHEGHYLDYLTAAHRVDKWLGELWYFIQHDPRYKNKTALIVTADHGRGDLDKKLWTSHKRSIPGSDQIWIALIGPGIAAAGESHAPLQLYQNQVAATIAELLGLHFTCEHAVAPSLYNK